MKVSLNIVKQYIGFELPPVEELVARINAQLGGVEEVIDLNAKYKDAKIVKIIECEKHANADKLSVCMVDAGDDEPVQVVCGANNVHAGMWAVWLPPESTVPATYDGEEPFVLGAREIRGVMSNGMLASARELAIGDDHDGIVDITDADIPKGKTLKPGDSFAEVFGLNDHVIDIENKMFTHRPDLFGQLGVAREIAGIFGKQFTSPSWYKEAPVFSNADTLSLEIFNDAPDKAPRFMAVAVEGVEVKQSPLWLKCALVAMGGKPINNIVDATNYIMLLTAQPVHAYDYDKIRGQRLGVRMARGGERLPLLNGKTYELTSDDIVIADNEGAIGMAGIMGGANSEVSAATKNIVLEVANFNMYAVRKSSMRHGLFTDALTRFNKGQSPLQTPYVMAKLMQLVGGTQASEMLDQKSDDLIQDGRLVPTIHFINERLGLSLSIDEMKDLLQNVELKVSEEDGSSNPNPNEKDYPVLIIFPPFWRTDLELDEDIVEEIGRLHGFDKLPRELPRRGAKPVAVNAERELEQSMREILARAGANEVVTYSFVNERILQAAGQDVADAYKLSNALSPDLQYYRLSLTPSLLDRIHPNIKSGYDEFALFEIGRAHSKRAGLDEQNLPVEPGAAALVYASKDEKSGAAFYRAKTMLNFLVSQLGLTVNYEPLGDSSTAPASTPFEPKRSAIVTDKATGLYIGLIGEYKKHVARNFKLPAYAAGFELDTKTVLRLGERAPVTYKPLGRFPAVERDITLRVQLETDFIRVSSELERVLRETGLDIAVEPLGIYLPEGAGTKSITFRISLTSREKTLSNQEVNEMIERVTSHLKSSVDAEIV